jgi:hypothetical protein
MSSDTKVDAMINLVRNIPNIQKNPLDYVLETIQFSNEQTLWLEFGVYKGSTINKISEYSSSTVYGFDSFEGLPTDWRPKYSKGAFSLEGQMPEVRQNVRLVKGWFEDTLKPFLETQQKKISFLHIDSDLYSSAKYILDTCREYFTDNCMVVFDELVNFEYFEDKNSELMAFYDFIQETQIPWKWVGMEGELNLTLTKGIKGYYYPYHQSVAVCFNPC